MVRIKFCFTVLSYISETDKHMLRVRRNQQVAREMIIVSPWIMVNGKHRVLYTCAGCML